MQGESVEKRFLETIRGLLVSLPYDMKVLFEAISDENLPTEARTLAAGTVIYCLSPSDPIPDTMGLIGFVDDVVLLRLALRHFLEIGGEDSAAYKERFTDQFKALDEELEIIEAYLGDSIGWLKDRVGPGLLKARYKGKDPLTYTTDDEASEYLYTEGLEFTTHYEIDDKAAAKLLSGKPVLEAFQKRMAIEQRRLG